MFLVKCNALTAARRRDDAPKAVEQRDPVGAFDVDAFGSPVPGHAEIATLLRCPTGTVKTRMFHGRRRLKELLAHRREDAA